MFCLLWQKNKSVNKYTGKHINDKIERIVPTIWEEHCLECSPPECYKSCEKYRRREDGSCIRLQTAYQLQMNSTGFTDTLQLSSLENGQK